ncbi:MAG: thiamine pyrophosphate-binding protein [Myxococcota bacterium]|nr:thiamine pyrophosphate-binding protein [Myxococcota bacterium]
MARVSGGRLAARVMKTHGIDHLFGIIGGHVYPVFEGCEAEGIRVIDVRHEESGAHMAEGWALTTGRPAACVGTAGPGFTNMLTGVANAYAGSSPLLAIGGRATLQQFDTRALQDFNQIDIVKPMTKYARSIFETERIPEYFDTAIHHATHGRPGPVYLETPMDRLFAEVDEAGLEMPTSTGASSLPAGNPDDVERAIALIDRAQKPVVVAGAGVWWAQAQDDLKAFVERADLPLFTRAAGRGCVPDDHPLVIAAGIPANPVTGNALAQADLIILFGSRFGFTFEAQYAPPTTKIVRVDVEPSAFSNGREAEVGIVGDAGVVLRQLTAGVAKASHKEWIEQLRASAAGLARVMEPALHSEQTPIHPLRLFHEISKFVDADTVLSVGGGDMCAWGNLVLPAPGPGQFLSITSSIFGCLGVAVPYAIAAQLAHPEKRVIATTGDGSFGFTCMEMETAARHGVPIVAIVGNDQGWGMIKRDVEKHDRAALPACDLGPARYDKIVEGMGGHGEFVEQPEDLGPAIQRALDSGLPACVNVLTDPKIGPALG